MRLFHFLLSNYHKINILNILYLTQYLNLNNKYYSINMVDVFSDYKIYIVPEDINAVLGAGFNESVVCSCAYIGYDKIDYSKYGLVPNKDYITYDGTI